MSTPSMHPTPPVVNANFVPALSGAELYRLYRPISECVTEKQRMEYISERNWDAYYAAATGKPTACLAYIFERIQDGMPVKVTETMEYRR